MEKKMTFSNSQLRRLIIPLLVEQLLVILVGMLDTVMVSSAGEAAISGVSIVNEVNFLVITILTALSAGGAVIVSQYLGNNDQKNANLTASQLMTLSFLVSALFTVICLLFCKPILMALYGSVDADVMQAAITYFWITTLSFPFLGIYNSAASVYRSMNETRTTMKVSIIMNAINIVGNYIGVFILHLGVAGVAWPTVISRAFAAIMLSSLSFSHENRVYIEWKDILKWQSDIQKRVLKIAVPNAIENGLFQLGRVIVTVFISTYGTNQVAANGVTNSFGTLSCISSGAMQLAVVTVVGQCVGANDYDSAKYYIKRMLRIAYLIGIVNNVLVLVLIPAGLRLYSLSEETAAIVKTVMMWNCIAVMILHPMSFVLPNALRAAGDAKFTMVVGVCSMFFCRILFAYILGTKCGLYLLGTYFAMFLDWIVRIICFVYRLKSGKWMNYRAI